MDSIIGIDIHRKFSEVYVTKKDGEEIERKRLEHNDPIGVREFFEDYSGASAEPLSTFASVAYRWQPDESIGSGVYLVRATIPQQTASAVCTKRVVYLK